MRTILDTIATYDTETGTTLQTRVIPLFEFHELSDDAQTRVVEDYAEERANDPYFSQWFIDCYESDIWACVRDLEKSITGARVQWQYNRWYSCDFDCEYKYDDCYDPGYMDTVKDTGYYASMDLCDAWNAHARKLNGLYYQYEYLDYLCWDVYNEYDYDSYHDMHADIKNASFFRRADALRDHVISLWYEELERACGEVRDTIETLLRAEWDYYTSEEYTRMECEDESTQGGECHMIDRAGRIFYSDNRKWYTAGGEFFEQSNVNHQCVSIVKAG